MLNGKFILGILEKIESPRKTEPVARYCNLTCISVGLLCTLFSRNPLETDWTVT